MINEIIESICEKVHEGYPDFEYLTEFLPENMSRPSVFCEFVKLISQKRMLRNVLKKTELYQITYFAPADEYGKAKKSDINKVLSKITDIFSDGVLKCGERFYTITATLGGQSGDEGFIDLTLERCEYTVCGTMQKEADENGAKMKFVNTRIGGM